MQVECIPIAVFVFNYFAGSRIKDIMIPEVQQWFFLIKKIFSIFICMHFEGFLNFYSSLGHADYYLKQNMK